MNNPRAAFSAHFSGWRRTVYIMYFVQFVSTLGFSVIFPFLPLYIEDLGTYTDISIEVWAGLVFSAQAFTMMFASPIWGALADRYGRKLMVQRATFGASILLLLMAFVTSAEELVLLRAIQGLVTGTVAAANALVVATVPRDKVGASVGGLEMARWGGISLGPLLGGVLADALGYAAPFVVTAILLLAAGILVQFGVKEHFTPPEKHTSSDGTTHHPGILAHYRHVLAAPGVSITYSLRFMSFLGRSVLLPVIPLLMLALLPQNADNVASITGTVTAVASFAGTISAVYLGRLGDRVGHRRVLPFVALVGGLGFIPQAFVTEAWQLLALQALTGAAAGGIAPVLSSLLAGYTDPGEEGAVYGLDNSIVAGARTVAPLLGGAMAAFSLRTPFLVTGLVFVVVAIVAVQFLPRRSARTTQTIAAAGD